MKIKIRKVDIIVLIIIVVIVGFIFISKHTTKKNECIKGCIYGQDGTGNDNAGRFHIGSGEMVWKFDNRIFKTKEECLNYCMVIK